MKLKVFDTAGKELRELDAADEVFGIEPNRAVLHQAYVAQMANRRAGNASTKRRGEVAGSTIKIRKQKGLGRSRQGSIRASHHVGGGSAFGPKPHSYDIKLNRKVKDLAKISALSVKAKENSIIIVEDLKLDAPKTKQFKSILSNLNINVDGKKTLVVLPEYNDNVYLSLRNIPTVDSTVLSDVNTYEIMNSNFLVLTESAAKIFAEDETVVEA